MTTATQRIIKSKGGEITVRDFLGLLTRGDARYLRTSRLDEIQTTTVDMSGSVEGYLMPKHSIKPSLVFPCYFENKSQAQE